MSLINTVYTLALRKNSTFWLTSIIGVFAFERMIDVGCDKIFDEINKGKQWKDIKDKYGQ